MALPWLESFNVWGDEPGGSEPASQAPVRLAVLFAGQGSQRLAMGQALYGRPGFERFTQELDAAVGKLADALAGKK